MFGHQQNDQTDNQAIPDDAINQVIEDQSQSAPQLPASDGQDWQHPGVPIDGAAPEDPAPISDVISPAGGYPKAPTFPPANPEDEAPVPIPAPSDHIAGDHPADTHSGDDSATHELIDIKTHALTELAPLIDQLDQPPEEKFRTIMMMIQASDDQHLVKAAYEAAHGIEDDKARARALLDIVNEVNYFTQQPEG